MPLTKTKIKFFIIAVLFLAGFSFFSKVHAQEFAPGDVKGFAWMGQNIVSGAGVAQGGGGWINMNCKLSYCDNGNWGVSMNLSSGAFSGYAWSSNYGWLSFNTSQVASCWQDNGGNSDYTATASLNGGQGSVPIDGWAKFLNGDDIQDGYDGCVKFKGQNFSSMLNQETGSITGWAWGGPVVGWISFNNSECNGFCDTAVVLEEITGCMDPSAPNYNPLANVPGPCDPTPPNSSATIVLEADPSTLYEGNLPSGSDVNLIWYSPDNLDSCVGTVTHNGTQISLGNWTNTSLPDPANPPQQTVYNNHGGFFLNYLYDNASAPSTFVFKIACEDENGVEVSDTATVQYVEYTPPTEPPVVQLFIIEPNVNPVGGSQSVELLPPLSGANPVTLKWSALNVNSCVASSTMYVGNAGNGSNPQWSGQSLADDNPLDNTQDITNMTDPNTYLKNTVFTISCIPDNSAYGTAPISAHVCVGLAGVPFTQCSATTGGSGIPSFIEI